MRLRPGHAARVVVHPETVEFATLERVGWVNNRPLLEPIGNTPQLRAETRLYAQSQELAVVA